MTSTTASMRLRSVSPTAAVTDCDRSMAMLTRMFGGRVACTDGSTFLIWATVLMIFAPGSGKTITPTVGRPLNRPALRMFSLESTTAATSCKRTGAPPR